MRHIIVLGTLLTISLSALAAGKPSTSTLIASAEKANHATAFFEANKTALREAMVAALPEKVDGIAKGELDFVGMIAILRMINSDSEASAAAKHAAVVVEYFEARVQETPGNKLFGEALQNARQIAENVPAALSSSTALVNVNDLKTDRAAINAAAPSVQRPLQLIPEGVYSLMRGQQLPRQPIQ